MIVEDLISTGGSSAKAVQEVRDAGALVTHCFSIFSYGLEVAAQAFGELSPHVQTDSLLTYAQLLPIAIARGDISAKQQEVLQEWMNDPFNWGEKHGFPKVEKK